MASLKGYNFPYTCSVIWMSDVATANESSSYFTLHFPSTETVNPW